MKRIAAAVLAIAVCLTGAITLSSCVPEELSGYTYEFVEVKELFYGDGHYSRQKYAEAVAAISEDYADAEIYFDPVYGMFLNIGEESTYLCDYEYNDGSVYYLVDKGDYDAEEVFFASATFKQLYIMLVYEPLNVSFLARFELSDKGKKKFDDVDGSTFVYSSVDVDVTDAIADMYCEQYSCPEYMLESVIKSLVDDGEIEFGDDFVWLTDFRLLYIRSNNNYQYGQYENSIWLKDDADYPFWEQEADIEFILQEGSEELMVKLTFEDGSTISVNMVKE